MTNKPTKEAALPAVAEELVEDLLATPDDEVLAEVRASGSDPEVAAAEVRRRIQGAVAQRRRNKLAAARKDYDASAAAARRQVLAHGNADVMRAKVTRLLMNPNVPSTLAARFGKGSSEADLASLLSDLEELGFTDDGEG